MKKGRNICNCRFGDVDISKAMKILTLSEWVRPLGRKENRSLTARLVRATWFFFSSVL